MIPSIDISFTALANSFSDRSYSGIVTLIAKSSAEVTTISSYAKLSDLYLDKYLYSDKTYRQLSQVFEFDISTLNVVHLPAEDYDVEEATRLISTSVYGGIVSMLDGSADEYKILVEFAKMNTDKFYTTVVYNVGADNKHIVNYNGTEVAYTDGTVADAIDYISSVCAIITSCSGNRASTYYTCHNLTNVTEDKDVALAVACGEFRLINDYDKVRVSTGINSLQNLKESENNEMKYIDTIDTMNLIQHDISTTFKENYIGKVRNGYNNQMMFISDVNDYFKKLALNELLESEYDNKCYIDVDAQRNAITEFLPAAVNWSDDEIKKYSVDRKMYLAADIKVLGAMEHLTLNISME